MNTRGYSEYGYIIALLFAIAVLTVLSLFVVSYFTLQEEENQCKSDCKEHGAAFVQYDSGNRGANECWCKKEGKPLRIW